MENEKRVEMPEDLAPIEMPEAEGEPEAGETLAVRVEHEPDREAARREEGRERLENLRRETSIENAVQSSLPVPEYIERYLPKHLHRENPVAVIGNAVLRTIERVQNLLKPREYIGREHLPKDGAYIIVANHSRPNDPRTISLLSGRPLRIATADIHFSNPISAWLHRAVGLFEVRSTLTNLNAEEKAALMKRVPKHEQAYYRKAAERTPNMADVRQFVRETVALLARGDAVTVFPEGLWLFEGPKLRKAYPGLELVAREYRKLTGKDIPIIPMAISDRRVVIEEPTALQDGDDIHTIMKKIAAELPEGERGFYQ